MSTLFRLIPALVLAALLSQLLKKNSPSFSFLITLSAVAVIAAEILPELQKVTESVSALLTYSSLTEKTLLPLVRIVGVSCLTGVASALCRDAGESALSLLSEILGAVSALIIALPLFSAVMSVILSLIS